MNKILFISPHPDDETLGCGGTILKHEANGDKTFLLIMTNMSQEGGFNKSKIKNRQNEIKRVTGEYGFEKIFKLDFPTTRLDVIPKSQLIKSVSNVIKKVKPDIVYIPNGNDVHTDHKVTFDVMISSTKTFRCSFIKKILAYEVISETEFSPSLSNAFIPNSFSDITKYFDKKISIMQIYKGEMDAHPFPRSVENIKALATFRGATADVKYAEAFMILKEIW
jgi:LmbE family N-acetylglucosaminyl deacetylase